MNLKYTLPFLGLILMGGIGQLLARTDVYFSPNGGATTAIVQEIEKAKKEVLVQAYSFTSAPIADAIVKAKKRGLHVIVILDKSQKSEKYSALTFLRNEGVETWIDYRPAIAHSKVMIIDRSQIITGSFNFTKSAEERNTENLLIIKNEPELVIKYLKNFEERKSLSTQE